MQFNQTNNKSANVGIIIQARLGSERLPNKIIKKILNKRIIEYLIERLQKSFKDIPIIISTTNLPEDKLIVDIAKNYNLNFFCGATDDVLNRFYETAKEFNINNIVRITSDCPLIESQVIKKIVNFYLKNSYTHVCSGQTFAEGLDCEIFSFEALKKANFNAKKKSEREHVTLYFKNQNFKRFSLENDKDESKYRIVLDYPEDFEVIKSIIEELYPTHGPNITFSLIKKFLDSNSQISKINSKITRNDGLLRSIENEKK